MNILCPPLDWCRAEIGFAFGCGGAVGTAPRDHIDRNHRDPLDLVGLAAVKRPNQPQLEDFG